MTEHCIIEAYFCVISLSPSSFLLRAKSIPRKEEKGEEKKKEPPNFPRFSSARRRNRTRKKFQVRGRKGVWGGAEQEDGGREEGSYKYNPQTALLPPSPPLLTLPSFRRRCSMPPSECAPCVSKCFEMAERGERREGGRVGFSTRAT